ncbi:hypothetical protein [Nocardioides litoris]|uniref:hypothetical protein n=1 Tax=Nocardioides litoris TaxID=1926648 RepID=UPI001123F7F9|nr:hypothetical protein [Nocardioides litoris]
MTSAQELRAMREAKFARARAAAGGAAPASAPSAPAATKPRVAPPVAPPATATDAVIDAVADELCGHRNMGGRTCTREKGHAAKNHRYS